MRLVACTACHAHIDVTCVTRAHVRCRCGATVANRPPEPLDLPVHRCAACGAALGAAAETCGYCRAAVVRDPGRLGLVCPECFARTVEGGRFCVACGVEIRPCEVGGADDARVCPACDVPLHAVGIDRVVVHECRTCHGTWVRPEDFDGLVARVAASSATPPSAGLGGRRPGRAVGVGDRVVYRRCPDCRQVMHRRNFGRSSGVVVDWCRAHGTWFDATELAAVATFVRAGGLDDRGRGRVEETEHAVATPLPSPGARDDGDGLLAQVLRLLFT